MHIIFRGFYAKSPEIWTFLGNGPQILYITNEVFPPIFFIFLYFFFSDDSVAHASLVKHLAEYPCLGHFLANFPKDFLAEIWGFRRPYYELIIFYFSLNYNHVCLRFKPCTFATRLRKSADTFLSTPV